MTMNARRVLAALLFAGVACAAGAQDRSPNAGVGLLGADLRTNWYGIVPSGADAELEYGLPRLFSGLDTFVELDLGGGYVQNVFFRNADGTPVTSLPDGEDSTEFNQSEFLAALGLRQGLLFNPTLQQNLVEAFFYYRYHYDYDYNDPSQSQLIFESAFPDRVSIAGSSVLAGFDYDTTKHDKLHKTWNGIYAETSAEWGPSWLLNSVGGSDFLRYNATAYGFYTIYTSDRQTRQYRLNQFSIYAGDYASVDWATGSSIPIYVSQTFGGRSLRTGLGDAVRGFEAGAWDTRFKAMNSFEIRATGPSIVIPSLVPGMFAFFDSGVYGGGYFGSPTDDASGVLASVGVGAYLVVLDLLPVVVDLAIPVVGTRVDGSPYAIQAHFHLNF